MPSPEQRFEVPPEYADVYERAYRRAYEEGQGQLGSTLVEAPTHRSVSRGKRIAVPEQRTSRRSAAQRSPAHLATSRVFPARAPKDLAPKDLAPRVISPVATGAARGTGHRSPPRGGSTLFPVLALVVLMVLLMVGAFALGRATAGTVSSPDTPQSGTRPGATASATEGVPQASSSLPAPGPYSGPKAPLRISDASAACTARGAHHAYSARNVLDRDPRTAWRCDGRAVGQQLVLSLPHHSEVVSVGLMQASGKQSAITRVAWIFDNGTRVFQTLSGRGKDHTLQQLQIVPMVTDSVKLRILGTAGGPRKGASISTVRIDVSARGSD